MDARDALLGRLFGCAAVVRSGRVQDSPLAVKLLQYLLEVAASKSFLKEAAVDVVLELLDGLPRPVASAALSECAELRELLSKPPADSSPEVRLIPFRILCVLSC